MENNLKQAVEQLEKYKNEEHAEIKNLYSVYDDAIGFTDVFVQPNDAIAFRMFETMATNPQSPINKYAKHMTLCKIGEMNALSGEIRKDIRKIVNANDILETEKRAQEEKQEYEERKNQKNIN